MDFLILNQVFSQLSRSLLQVLFTKRWGNLGGELVQLELQLVDSKTTSSCFNEVFEIPLWTITKKFILLETSDFKQKFVITSAQHAQVKKNSRISSAVTASSDSPVTFCLWTFPCGHFPPIWITPKRNTNSTFWLHFWGGFEASSLEQPPVFNYLDFCGS